jgi:hypothetical protein
MRVDRKGTHKRFSNTPPHPEGFLFSLRRFRRHTTHMSLEKTHHSLVDTLALTRRRLEAAPQALAAQQPVLYFIQETTSLGGTHGAFALHDAVNGQAHLTIPEQNNQVIMTLHALEAVVHGIVAAQTQGVLVDFPDLQFHHRPAFAARQREQQAQLVRVSLNVAVDTTHLLVTHRNFRSKDLSLEQIVVQYYQLLLEKLKAKEMTSLLSHFPVNTMLVHAGRMSEEQPEKDRIGLSVRSDKNHSRDTYPLVHAGKINGMHWRHPDDTTVDERNS